MYILGRSCTHLEDKYTSYLLGYLILGKEYAKHFYDYNDEAYDFLQEQYKLLKKGVIK